MTDHDLTLAARSGGKMQALAEENAARTVQLDATDESAVAALFDPLPAAPRVVPSARARGPVAQLSLEDVRNAIEVTAIGGALAGKHSARRMLGAYPIDGVRGTILFTGASSLGGRTYEVA